MHPVDATLFLLSVVTAIAFAALIVLVAASAANGITTQRLSFVFSTVAVLQLIQFGLMAAIVERALTQPWLLDLNPYDGLVHIMLNWYVPAAAITLIITFVFHRRLDICRAIVVSSGLIACTSSVTIWYGQYIFCIVLGGSLRDSVWWL